MKIPSMVKFLCVVVLFWVSVLNPVKAVADPMLSVGSKTVDVGATFWVPISIAKAVDLTSWQFDISFNPALLQADSVMEGPFMSSFGATLFVPGVIDNGAGLISLVSDFYTDLPPDPSGTGVLANIEFTALAPGQSSVS